MRKNNIKNWALAASILCAVGCTQQPTEVCIETKLPAPDLRKMSSSLYGFDLEEDMKVINASFTPTKTQEGAFVRLLQSHKIDKEVICEVIEKSLPVFDLRYIEPGKKCTVIKEGEQVQYIVYEKSKAENVVVDLRDSISVYAHQKELQVRRREVAIKISTSIYASIEKAGYNPELATKISEVMQWSFDFFRIKQGDMFKVIFDEEVVDGKSVGVTDVYALSFTNQGKEYYAFKYEQNGKESFYDENGNSLRKAFLKAPLKFSRISSGFSTSRFHPILHIYRAHNGIDYAAPKGTPIMAIGDGTVLEAAYGGGNGNYVKIKHNSTYTSQYLHMSKFGDNIKKGSSVKQGDIIGYVGSTGLATGPHLCFRFWKNGVQVNPATNMAEAMDTGIASNQKAKFKAHVAEMKESFLKAHIFDYSSMASL